MVLKSKLLASLLTNDLITDCCHGNSGICLLICHLLQPYYLNNSNNNNNNNNDNNNN